MNLVDKHYGLLAESRVSVSLLHDVANFLDTAGNSGKGDEIRLGLACDYLRKGSLSDSRRSPEYHRRNLIGFNQSAQNLVLSYEVLLTRKLTEILRSHARS